MACINLEVCTSTEELVPQIVDSLSDPIEFILNIDEYIADEGFTLDLIKRLATSMAKEYKESSDHVTGRVVEQEFGEGEPSHPSLTWNADDIKNYDNAHKAMMGIIEIVDRLSC
jgi:hypothetical protein